MASDTKKEEKATVKKGTATKKTTAKKTVKKSAPAPKKTTTAAAKKTTSAKASTKKTAAKPAAKAAEKKQPAKSTKTTVKAKSVSTTAKTAKAPAKKSTAKKVAVKKTAPKPVVEKEEKLNKTIVLSTEEKQEIELKTKDEVAEIKVAEKVEKTESKKEAFTILGSELPTGINGEDKKKRIGHYAKDALIFSIIIPILDLFAMLFIDAYKAYPITTSDPLNYAMTLIIDFVIIFALTFIIDYVHGEAIIKRINQ